MDNDTASRAGLERRGLPMQRIEVRAAGEGKGLLLAGYAAVFDQLSEDLGGFREQVAKGAFAETIKGDDIRALFNHRDDFVLGRNTAGTLRLAEDDKGLAIEIDLPDTQFARDLHQSIKRGDINQMSFGFSVIDQAWETKDAKPLRTLRKVRLWDVSPVTFPAYPQTDVAVRSLDAWRRAAQPAAAPLSVYLRRQALAEAAIG